MLLEQHLVQPRQIINKKLVANSAGYEQESGTGTGTDADAVSGGICLSMLPTSAAVKVEKNDGLKPQTIENRQSISLNVPGRDKEAIWSTISSETDLSLLAKNHLNTEFMKAHAIENNKHYNNTSSVPELDSDTSWNPISGPSKLESNTAAEYKVYAGPNIPGHDSGTT
ncbi:hypothetical protein SOVF_048740 [Spinacia oleracea]|nr:hypothetical protein SOVF_048740 [Spinacia oleracea]